MNELSLTSPASAHSPRPAVGWKASDHESSFRPFCDMMRKLGIFLSLCCFGSLESAYGQAPSNDDFANRETMASQLPSSATGSNVGATAEAGEYFFDSPETVWWTWTAPSTGWVAVNPAGSSFGATVFVFKGTHLNSIEEVANPFFGFSNGTTRFLAEVGVAYHFQVAGVGGATGSVALEVAVTSAPTLPVLNAISFDAYAFDITAGPATVTATLELTTPDGWEAVYVNLFDEDGDYVTGAPFYFFQRIDGGDPTDYTGGVYEGQFDLPPFRAGGTWTVEVSINEANGDNAYYSTGEGGLPFPSPFTGRITIINSGTVDMDFPEVTSLTFTPSTVDVTDSSQEVTVRVAANDSSGIRQLYFSLYDPNDEYLWLGHGFNLFFNRISGGAQDGIYEDTFTIPQLAQAGEWNFGIQIEDNAGYFEFYGEHLGDLPIPGGPQPVLTVVNNAGPDMPPVLLGVTATPSSVDVSGADQSVVVQMEVSDDVGVNNVVVNLPDQPFGWGASRISGDAKMGVYQATVNVPRYSPPSAESFTVEIRDSASQAARYGVGADPLPAGSTDLEIVNSGMVDLEPPRLTSLTFDPSKIDPNALPVTVMATFQVTDDVSGVVRGHLQFQNGFGQGDFGAGGLVSGTPQNGTFSLPVTITRVTEQSRQSGEMRTFAVLWDGRGLISSYGSNHDDFPEDFAPLRITQPIDAYDAWLALHPEIPVGMRGIADDPDGDRIPNGVEFFLGLLPMANSLSLAEDPNSGNLPKIIEQAGEFGIQVGVSQTNLSLGDSQGLVGSAQVSVDGKSWETPSWAPNAGDVWEFTLPRTDSELFLMRFAVTRPAPPM